jgi:hypothetical protein
MQNLDIPCPDTEYRMIYQCRSFNLIYPVEHPLAQTVRGGSTIRLLSFDDTEYTDLIKNPKDVDDIVPLGGKFYEIFYIRECKISNVTRNEWENNFGPRSIKSYMRSLNDINMDSYVKVINLRNPSYSLKELNFKYGKNE